LLWAVSVPEAILRLLLRETDIERVFEPPQGYDPDLQGDWVDDLVIFAFKRRLKLDQMEREREHLTVCFLVESIGHWSVEIGPERVVIERV
jgi:hypothetical protein